MPCCLGKEAGIVFHAVDVAAATITLSNERHVELQHVPVRRPMSRPHRSQKKEPVPWARLFISLVPGYGAALLTTVALTSLLPVTDSEQTFLGFVLFWLFYCSVGVRVFAVNREKTALRDIAIVSVVSLVVILTTASLSS